MNAEADRSWTAATGEEISLAYAACPTPTRDQLLCLCSLADTMVFTIALGELNQPDTELAAAIDRGAWSILEHLDDSLASADTF